MLIICTRTVYYCGHEDVAEMLIFLQVALAYLIEFNQIMLAT